jgi:asparagine synthase (glutamine-hydrolysing)
VDYAAMYHSLEVRLPFLDSELVRWALQLPDSFRINGGVRKRILRDAFAPNLPKQIVTRRKVGFLLPIRRWFQSGRLRDQFEELVGQQTRFDRETIGALLKQHETGAADNSVLLWALFVYLRWSAVLPRWAQHAAPPQRVVKVTREGQQ